MSKSIEKATGTFWFTLILRHQTWSTEVINAGIGETPKISLNAGQVLGQTVKKVAYCSYSLYEGAGVEAFTEALDRAVLLVERTEEFLGSLVGTGGEAELTINQQVEEDDGVVFNMGLHAALLRSLAAHGVSLRVQAWMGSLA